MTDDRPHPSEMSLRERAALKARRSWAATKAKLTCWLHGHSWVVEEDTLPTATCVRCGQQRFKHTIGGRPWPELEDDDR